MDFKPLLKIIGFHQNVNQRSNRSIDLAEAAWQMDPPDKLSGGERKQALATTVAIIYPGKVTLGTD